MYIRQDKDLRKYGYIEGCPGCTAAATGTKAKGHSDACRQRIEEQMEAEEDGQRKALSATLLRKQMFSSAAATATAAPATAATTDSSSGVGRRSGLEACG